jgi:hypothetical protein
MAAEARRQTEHQTLAAYSRRSGIDLSTLRRRAARFAMPLVASEALIYLRVGCGFCSEVTQHGA